MGKNEQRWASNPCCLVLEPTHLSMMQTLSPKAERALSRPGQVGHSSCAPGPGHLL